MSVLSKNKLLRFSISFVDCSLGHTITLWDFCASTAHLKPRRIFSAFPFASSLLKWIEDLVFFFSYNVYCTNIPFCDYPPRYNTVRQNANFWKTHTNSNCVHQLDCYLIIDIYIYIYVYLYQMVIKKGTEWGYSVSFCTWGPHFKCSSSDLLRLLLCSSPGPPRLSGALCVAASTAATCRHMRPPLCTSSVCAVIRPPPTTACHRRATATRWWFAAAGNRGRDWGQRGRGLSSQCRLCWRETRTGWALDRWREPKWLTSNPGIVTQWSVIRRWKRRGEEKDRGKKKVGERSWEIRTGKEISVPLFIFDTCPGGPLLSLPKTSKKFFLKH